jgi:hypothetical protein
MKTGLLMGAAVVVAGAIGLFVQQRPAPMPHPAAAARSGGTGDLFDSDEPATDGQSDSLQGRVREVVEVAQYTYLRLATAQGELWAAVSKAPVTVDSDVTVENATRMEHFESATLKRTFDVIYFGNLPTGSGAASSQLPPGHPSIDGAAPATQVHGALSPTTPTAGAPDVKVPRASGRDAHSIGELFAESTKLEGKLVRVRGQVVKVTPGVLGKTYLRLRDGSGDRPEERELVVTSQAEAQVGVVSTFEGTLRTQVDVGIGFRYPILLADANVIADEPSADKAGGRSR